MLRDSRIVAFVATAKPSEAKRFYEGVLGLTLLEDSPYSLVFEANGTALRIQKVERVEVAGYTSLGWQVSNIASAIEHLSRHGVVFERFASLPQDGVGIWSAPDGSKVAWFKDPDGNTLSLTERSIP